MIGLIFPYAATTGAVTVRVAPRYLDEQSDPIRGYHVWAYQVRIENAADTAVQLMSRHWVIIDGDGRVEEVSGDGVVGVQPVIGAGQAYDYVSGCPLPTPSGTMHGYYTLRQGAARFDVTIPAFALETPRVRPAAH
ncbi:Co2+/Mg2+ efflux protein ApaG [Polymorphobacter fuscus]|uniref:Protein ApaG n=1 Tax=Sandarakinorhabdus fusca TaxID=1439888 RepID=A0A7C9KXB8_9SPHN|nr:Co2+/Mg2+ efflux protein ApaG [Polymorphobacter fuscus]KAB7646179.1 Co2+/Mg2+ efflux protein ApaG [Polymorphobacter fuscus]MQT17382.1 Co2+/Mg2+ efflux protein ApaG [Polymorphobacter fuscus]NJC10084.1 ApaG protein [Polymorphobacter fuscus]